MQDVVPQVVRGFKENREIYKELEYYKQHGQILGEHPVFEKMKALRDLRQLRGMELHRKFRATQKSIADLRRKLKLNDNPELEADRRERLDYREWEMEQILKLIKALERAEKAL